jgi:hypothetical protein
MGLSVRVFYALCSAIAVSCTGSAPSREPVQLTLTLTTRQSCGAFADPYDTACTQAVAIVVKDSASNRTLQTTCTPVEQPLPRYFDLRKSDTLAYLSGISTNKVVRFELYALHSKNTDKPCDDPANFRDWLIWGRSDDVDLSASNDSGTALNVSVAIECRDCQYTCENGGDCIGCGGLGLPNCSSEFPASFCVPIIYPPARDEIPVDTVCRRPCNDESECFEGARTCLSATGLCPVRNRRRHGRRLR